MTLNNCLFEENGKGSSTGPDVISVFGGATVEINNSKFLNNVNRHTIACFSGDVVVTESHFEGVRSVYYSKKKGDAKFTDCKFINNTINSNIETFYLEKGSFAEFDNCDIGDSAFNDLSRVGFTNCYSTDKTNTAWKANLSGSIFGEGSFVVVISILALVASIASLALVLYPKLANGGILTLTTTKEEDEDSDETDETSDEEVAEEVEATEEEATEATETTEE